MRTHPSYSKARGQCGPEAFLSNGWMMHGCKEGGLYDMGTHRSWAQVPAALLTLGKSLSLSDPQFPHFTLG